MSENGTSGGERRRMGFSEEINRGLVQIDIDLSQLDKLDRVLSSHQKDSELEK